MTPRRILVAAWVLFVLYGYPGFMRADAVDELADSRTGAFTDWGSPLLTEIWRILGRAFSGPAPLFLLTGTLVLVGTYLLVRRARSERAAAFAAACVLLAPPLLATTAAISEDALLSAFLVTGAALLLEAERRQRIAGFVLLTLAAGLTPGAIVAVVPIVIAGLRWPARKQLLAALAACAMIAGVSWLLDRWLVDARTYRPEVRLAMADLTGTLRRTPSLDDAALARELPGVQLAPASRAVAQPTTDADRDALIAARTSFTRAHPGAYLRHRMTMMSHLLGIKRPKNWRTVATEFIPRATRLGMGHDAHHSPVQRALIWPVKAIGGTLLCRPFLYFFAGIALLGVALVRRHGLAAMLLLSGLGYEIALGVVLARPEYRDSHWMMMTTVIAATVIVWRELEARHERVLEQTDARVAHDDRG